MSHSVLQGPYGFSATHLPPKPCWLEMLDLFCLQRKWQYAQCLPQEPLVCGKLQKYQCGDENGLFAHCKCKDGYLCKEVVRKQFAIHSINVQSQVRLLCILLILTRVCACKTAQHVKTSIMWSCNTGQLLLSQLVMKSEQ